jgi:hypothetical protein
VTVVTIRSGTHTVRVDAPDAAAAHSIVQAEAECRTSQCHCPPEWCTDDIQSDVVTVRGLMVPRL